MGSRVVMPRIMCVNCRICVNKLCRYKALVLDTPVAAKICSWVYPQIVLENDYVCKTCRDLAIAAVNNVQKEVSGSEEAEPRTKGHTDVCPMCGVSILRRRSYLIFTENPTEMQKSIKNIVECIVAPREISSSDRVCIPCWLRAKRAVIRMNHQDGARQQADIRDDNVQREENLQQSPASITQSESTSAIQTSKIIIANVYHYIEEMYEELTKKYEGVDLTPLSKFSEQTALATGVSETTILEILQERKRRNTDVPEKPVGKKRAARKRRRQPESSSEEDSSGGDEDDGEHSTTEHLVETLVVKEEPETYNDEPEVYVQLAGMKTEPDACGDDRELADPISVHVKTEPQNESDTASSETVGVQSAAKRLNGSIKQRNAEAPPASCAAPSGRLPLPPDQQLKVDNPLTNEQGFS